MRDLRTALIGVVIALGCWLALNFYKPSGVKLELKENETAKAVITRNNVTVVKRDAIGKITQKKAIYVPSEGSVALTATHTGDISVVVKDKGLCFRPGLGFVYMDGRGMGVLDVKLAYFKRFGATVGVPLRKSYTDNVYISLCYSVYSATSLTLGYAPSLAPREPAYVVVGVRVSF